MRQRRLVRRTFLWVVLAGFVALGATESQAADEPPENPFATVASQLRVGPSVRLRGAIVLSLRLPPAAQPGLDARVGVAGADTAILPLPGPAGRWHVRVSNREKRPLLIPAGTTLLTPTQPSRSVDRPVWIGAQSATFVPVIQRAGVVPSGPYVSRGQGLSHVELALVGSDRWEERVRLRNRRFGVTGLRLDDAGAAYTTPVFEEIEKRCGPELAALVAPENVVGVMVCDDRGPVYAHVQTDRARFKARWPSLRASILVDASMLEATGAAPRPGDDARLRGAATRYLAVLRNRPLRRPTFGEGWEFRWNQTDPPGHWDGLALPSGPVCVSLYLNPERPAGSQPPTGPADPPERPTQPGVFEGERRLRPTEEQKRIQERRKGLVPR